MKSKNLLGIVQFALLAAIGTTQLHQALPIMAKLAHRTAAPLEHIVLLGVNPSCPGYRVPAVQPSVLAPVQVCDRKTPVSPAHVRNAVLRVEAQRPMVETIVDPVVTPVRVRRMYVANVPDAHMLAQLVQVRMNQADVQREIARAQREMRHAMREQQIAF
jgi:hypothetical protein